MSAVKSDCRSTNILIYAHRTESPFHDVAGRRMRELAEANAPWAIPWPCVHEFLSVMTNPKAFASPARLPVAIAFIEALLESRSLTLLSETSDHWTRLQSLAMSGRTTGGRIHDARIAALCLEHRVREFWSADRDFTRFAALKVVNPLVG